MLLDFWIDKGAAVGLQLSESALLVGAHEPAVSCDIGREDRCEPTFRTLFGQWWISQIHGEHFTLQAFGNQGHGADRKDPKETELRYLPGGGTSGHFRSWHEPAARCGAKVGAAFWGTAGRACGRVLVPN
jgi:hypothetical protein